MCINTRLIPVLTVIIFNGAEEVEEEKEKAQNNGQHMLSAHFMSGSVIIPLHPLSHLLNQPPCKVSTELSSFSKSKAWTVDNDRRRVKPVVSQLSQLTQSTGPQGTVYKVFLTCVTLSYKLGKNLLI